MDLPTRMAEKSDEKTDLVLKKLKEVFKHDNFKSTLQKQAVKAVLKGTLMKLKIFLNIF